jgi:plastocyanin
MLRTVLAITLAGALVLPLGATAASQEYAVTIKNHRFEPSEITIPAGQKIKLVVDNQDPTPEEFESHAMNREKVIPGRSKASIWIGPLKPGSYDFVGEYHEDTARGKVIAK